MNDITQDTSTEAVERLADKLMAEPDHHYQGYGQSAAFKLRALAAERDRLRKEYDDFIGETWDREKTFARKMGALEEVLTSVLAWHDKDKHTSGKMTFEQSAAFAKARAALQEKHHD